MAPRRNEGRRAGHGHQARLPRGEARPEDSRPPRLRVEGNPGAVGVPRGGSRGTPGGRLAGRSHRGRGRDHRLLQLHHPRGGRPGGGTEQGIRHCVPRRGLRPDGALSWERSWRSIRADRGSEGHPEGDPGHRRALRAATPRDYEHGWYFRGAALLLAAVGVVKILRGRQACSPAGARAHWRLLLTVLVVMIVVYGALYALTSWLARAAS